MTPERVVIGNAERVWIYAICDPITNEPKYVGKTISSLVTRIREHKALARRIKNPLPVHQWLNDVEGINLAGAYLKVLEAATTANWQERERHWIRHGRSIGWLLFNRTSGGQGCHGLVRTPEHIEKCRNALRKGREFVCPCGKKFWRKPLEIAKGNCRFCSRECYAAWQKGRSKQVSTACKAAGIEAAAAKRRARTHCKRGHLLSGENLFFNSSGSRGCKECRKIHKGTYHARRS